jgi:hypothetical protein
MKNKVFLKFLWVVTIAVTACFTTAYGVPQVDIKVVLISVSGDTTVLMPGDDASSLNAPLRAVFSASLTTDDGKDYVLFPEWTVTRSVSDGGTVDSRSYLKRQESVTEYEFTNDGKFQIEFAWSYREKDATETIPGDTKSPMTFSIDDCEVRFPFNAFSPNGDNTNDVYKIYVRSVVNIKVSIFNRWGQTIKTISGRMDDILPFDAVPDNGGYLFEVWDGTYNGEVVNDGVYYINVQATGAGGREIEKRGDINILKGLGVQQ